MNDTTRVPVDQVYASPLLVPMVRRAFETANSMGWFA
jgi:hypothetical protein